MTSTLERIKNEPPLPIKGDNDSELSRDIVYELENVNYVVKAHFDKRGENLLSKIARLLCADIHRIKR